MSITNAEIENRKLIVEHNRHRRRLGYSYMRAPWSGTDSIYGPQTVEDDNHRLIIMNRIYEESTTPQEANAKIEATGISKNKYWEDREER